MSDATALGDLPELLARGMVGIAAQAALGFAVATLARSQLAGIGFGIALYFVGSFALLFLPQVVKYLPFQLANSALDIGRVGLGNGGALAEFGTRRAKPGAGAAGRLVRRLAGRRGRVLGAGRDPGLEEAQPRDFLVKSRFARPVARSWATGSGWGTACLPWDRRRSGQSG